MSSPRALIATAVPLEYESVTVHLENVRTLWLAGQSYTVGDFAVEKRLWHVLVLQTGPGNSEAASATAIAIALWNPLIAMFSGIAGGLKDLSKGDLCVPAEIHQYESGKALAQSKFLPRAKTHLPSSSLHGLAKSHIVLNNWRKRIKVEAPAANQQVAYGHLVAGEKVLGDLNSSTVKFLKKNYSHAIAVDMEGYGFLSAVYRWEDVKGLLIRCISDNLGDKGAHNDAYQPLAAGYASAFAFEILAHMADPNESVLLPDVAPPDAPLPPTSADFTPIAISPIQSGAELDALQNEIGAIRQLIRDGKFVQAEASLTDLCKQAEKESANLLFNVKSLLARCHLYQGHLKQAQEEFGDLLKSSEADANTFANAAQVACFLKDAPEALRLAERAREFDTKNGFAASINLFALHLLKRQDLIDSLIAKEPWLLENADCLFVLAGNECERRNLDDAMGWIDRALEKEPNLPQAMILKAQIIFKSVQSAVVTDVPLYGILSWAHKELVEKAESILTEAIKELRAQDFKDVLTKAYITRSGIRAMLQDKDGCLSDCTEVLLLEPDQKLGLVNMALALINKQAYASAVKYLERAKTYYGTKIALHLGLAYLKSNQLDKALQVLQPLYDSSEAPDIHGVGLLIETQSRLGNAIAVQEIIESLTKKEPTSSEVQYLIALQLKREGRFEDAKAPLGKAVEYATGERKRWMIEELANIHNLLLEYDSAALLYESIAAKDDDTAEMRQLVVAKANSGRYEEAYKLAVMLRKKSGPIPVVTEIEIKVLAEMKRNVKAARNVLRALVVVDPTNQWHYLNIAKMSLFMHEPEAAREALMLLNREGLTQQMLASLNQLEKDITRIS